MGIINKYHLPLLLIIFLVGVEPLYAGIDCSSYSSQVSDTPVSSGPNSASNPTIALRHIFCGEINRSNKATGFHSRPGDSDPKYRPDMQSEFVKMAFFTEEGKSVSDPSKPPTSSQRYTGRVVNVLKPGVGHIAKKSNNGASTFFPNDCDSAQVIASVKYAFINETTMPTSGNSRQFRGPSGPTTEDKSYCYDTKSTFVIEGWLNKINSTWKINTAYPKK